MLRSIQRNAVAHRRLIQPPTHRSVLYRPAISPIVVGTHPVPLHIRFISTPGSSTDQSASQKSPDLPPPPIQNRKPKVGLRPGPIKSPRPSTVSPTHNPINRNPGPGPKPPSASGTPPPLNAVKETAKRDIEEAEAHGILTPPPPDANWFRRTLHKGIQLAKFYYRGVKLIFVRRKEIAEIRARIKAGGAPMTRAEFRFIQTQRDDVKKLIPFIIIAVLLEEVIPLIAIYAPFLLPSTCVLPSQQQRIQEKRTEKALGFAFNYSRLFAELKANENPSGYLPIDAIRTKDAPTAICGLLGLSTYGNDPLRIHRIRRHLEFLAEDDRLLIEDSTPLSEKELIAALEERGIVAKQMAIKSPEAKLKWWLQSSDPDEVYARRLSLMVRHSADLRSLYP